MRLLLVRHGESAANVAGALDSSVPGPGLSSLGRAQADRLAASLADSDLRLVAASTMLRSQQTAAMIAEQSGAPLRVHPGLREIHKGNLHLRTDSTAHRENAWLMSRWLLEGDLDTRSPGGESGAEAVARFRAAVLELLAPIETGTVVIVSHGGVLRLGMPALDTRVPPRFALDHQVPNTGVISIDIEAGRMICRDWAGHALGSAQQRRGTFCVASGGEVMRAT